MSMQFVLVRHATCALMDSVLLGRAIDAPLDAYGETEATRLAERLARDTVLHEDVLIETSPRRRTCQTAEVIAARIRDGHMPHAFITTPNGDAIDVRPSAICTRPELDEIDFGEWAGCSFSDLADRSDWREWNEHRGIARTPAGASVAALQTEVLDHLQWLIRVAPAPAVVLVTHAEIIRCVLLHCLKLSLDDYSRIAVGPASVSRVRIAPRGPEVLSINERLAGGMAT